MIWKDLKRISRSKRIRLKFDLEQLKDLDVLEIFQAMIGGKFVSLAIMNNEDADMDSMITTFNTTMIEATSEILRKHRQNLGHCRKSWFVRQKQIIKKEKIRTWRILEIQGSEQEHQVVHEKGKTKTE